MKSSAYAALRRFIEAGKTWVKLSSPDAGSKSGPPGYADRVAIARTERPPRNQILDEGETSSLARSDRECYKGGRPSVQAAKWGEA